MGKLGQLLRRTRKQKEPEGMVEETPRAQQGRSGSNSGRLGQLLRETREEQGKTLEEAESITRIRRKFLVALEEEDFDDLPTVGHVHGFLRNYVMYLGLDLNEVESLYAETRAAHRRFEPRIFHPKDIELSVPKPRPMLRATLFFWLVVVLVVAVVGGALFWQYGRPWVERFGWPWIGSTPTPTPTATRTPERVVLRPTATATQTRLSPTRTPLPPTPTATGSTPTVTEPTPEPTRTATLDSSLTIATPTSPPTDTPTPTPTRTNSVLLQIRVIERTWLQVTVDDQELPGELLQTDEEREWKGENTIYLICGNAGGVEVTVNGEDLGTLGERGQVVEKTWTPEGEITSAPEAERASGGEESATPAPTPTATTAP